MIILRNSINRKRKHKMKLFDLHCDTANKMYKAGVGLDSQELQVNRNALKRYDKVRQVFAVWTPSNLSDDDGYRRALSVIEHFDSVFDNDSNIEPIYGIEDSRILAGNILRLDELYRRGVHVLTLTWAGESCIGGSHDTHAPLTDFGRLVVCRALEMGIAVDVSHASREVTSEVSEIACEMGLPFIASHSNAYSVSPHTRNLTDEEFGRIVACGGIVGVSFYPYHLSGKERASTDDVIAHIEHYLSLGGENTVCIGSDFDGIEVSPTDLQNAADTERLFERLLARGFSERTVEAIAFGNAERFFNKLKNNN